MRLTLVVHHDTQLSYTHNMISHKGTEHTMQKKNCTQYEKNISFNQSTLYFVSINKIIHTNNTRPIIICSSTWHSSNVEDNKFWDLNLQSSKLGEKINLWVHIFGVFISWIHKRMLTTISKRRELSLEGKI